MIEKLRLKNFKNFRGAELALGPFSLLIGTNAAGKSNLRDAFRFLHGIGLGYSLADIFGDRYEGGVLQWRGIRGGLREAALAGTDTFRIEVTLAPKKTDDNSRNIIQYMIEVRPVGARGTPELVSERLEKDGAVIYDLSKVSGEDTDFRVCFPSSKRNSKKKAVLEENIISYTSPRMPFVTGAPEYYRYLAQKQTGQIDSGIMDVIYKACFQTVGVLLSFRFFDFEPEAMRVPSTPGQSRLGDRGENLSTALQAICENPVQKSALLEWIKSLTPMDAVDFEFPLYADGKTLVTLVESNGRKVSATSASDGTLRFLAILTALFGPSHERFNFIEELENGLHPTRLHLLVELIEQQVHESDLQVIATTHSPQLLRLIDPQHFNNSSIIYRPEDQPDAYIKKIGSLPEQIKTVLQKQDPARLFESGWFEKTLSFMQDDDAVGDQQ